MSAKSSVKKKLTAPEACILVVDDTEMNLMVAKGLLRPTGIMVDTSTSGEEGLSMLGEMLYDVIFVDQRMPEMNGEEMLKRIRALDNKNAKAPCIALTADNVIGARERYLSMGFDDYLSKPITYEAIERVLLNHLPEEKVHLEDGEELVDMDQGIRWCGDRDTYRQVLFQFFRTIDEKAKEIRDYFDAEDWENYTVKVHALKSSARVVGARRLSDFARELEEAGDAGDIEKIRRETEALLTLFVKHKEQMPKEWSNM